MIISAKICPIKLCTHCNALFDVNATSPLVTTEKLVSKETVIKLSPDITAPRCVVMTTRKTFIVSYGVYWHEMNRVCEVDMNGLMLKAFGSAPGKDVGQLNTPWDVSLDDEERIIVADYLNNKVLLLNKELMLQRVLVTWHQRHSDDAANPLRLNYDSHSGKLLVGLRHGHLDVCQLRH